MNRPSGADIVSKGHEMRWYVHRVYGRVLDDVKVRPQRGSVGRIVVILEELGRVELALLVTRGGVSGCDTWRQGNG